MSSHPNRERPPKTAVQQVLGQWPLAVVLLGVFVGLAVVASSRWRLGSSILGAAITCGGVLRVVLPHRRVGLLAVRNRVVDSTVLLIIGVGVLVLAWVVPPA